MLTEQEHRISELQGKAGSLWAGLKALTALTLKMRDDSEGPNPVEKFAEAYRQRRARAFHWGDDPSAAFELARTLTEQAEELSCSLDFMAFRDRVPARVAK